MKLKSIVIKNFKNIDEHGVTIAVAPITLLFGPNNAGKSTIIQALHLAREIFAPAPDFDKIKSYDNSVNLGKFVNYVHNHEIERIVSVKLEFDLNDVCYAYGLDDLDSIYANIHSIAVDFQISWNNKLEKAILSAYTIFINNKKLTTVKIEPDANGDSAKAFIEMFSIEALISQGDYLELVDLIKNHSKEKLPDEYKKYNIDSFSKLLSVGKLSHNAKSDDEESVKIYYNKQVDFLKQAGIDLGDSSKSEINSDEDIDDFQKVWQGVFVSEATIENKENDISFISNVKATLINFFDETWDFIKKPLPVDDLRYIKDFYNIASYNPFYLQDIFFKVMGRLPKSILSFINIDSFCTEHNLGIKKILSRQEKIFNNEYISFDIPNGIIPKFGKNYSLDFSNTYYEIVRKGYENKKYSLEKIFDKAEQSEVDELDRHGFLNFIGSTFLNIIPKDILMELESLLYLGPIREQLARGVVAPQKLSDETWAKGSAVWDLIATSKNEELILLNSRIKQLGLNYKIILRKR